MGFLQRLFGIERPEATAPVANAGIPTGGSVAVAEVAPQATESFSQGMETIPPERVGLNGEYDQSGLAKRVALAFDQNPDVDDLDTIYVAQRGSTVVLKGRVPDRAILNRLIETARSVHGAESVEVDQVVVG